MNQLKTDFEILILRYEIPFLTVGFNTLHFFNIFKNIYLILKILAFRQIT